LEGVKIKARSHIGYIPVSEDLQLVVKSKIENFNDFFYILEKAGLTPDYRRWLDEGIFTEFDESRLSNPPEFLVHTLLYKLRCLKRDGFYRKPLPQSEIRTNVKGKVGLTNTFRRCVMRGKPQQVHCTYFDSTADTIENRFIKYTVWRLIKTRLPRDYKQELRRFWHLFSRISFDPTERYFSEIERTIRKRRLPKSRSYYIDILSLCFLIVRNSTVVVKEGEDIRLSAFTINMDNMFEQYIRNILVEALSDDFKVLDGKKNRQKLFTDSEKPLITPDMMIYKDLECLVVADTKYKDKALPNADDWYQIISYTLALDVSIGVLVFSTDEPRSPRAFQIGNKTIWVYYFALQKLKAQEASLIGFFRERISEYTRIIQSETV
jgi:5-methylcytosine-specific restriction endonuclease McrBC regulatory subunit McrC